MAEINWAEAVRYLGYLREPPGEQVMTQLRECGAEIQRTAVPAAIWKRFPVQWEEGNVQIAGEMISSQKLCKHLRSCEEVFLFAATLGLETDRVIRRGGILDMSRAVMLQACAASLLEDWCDECGRKITEEIRSEGLSLCSRFSPGYGDFSVEHQHGILGALEASKRIGLTLTEERMLNPVKSVTAVIGVRQGERSCAAVSQKEQAVCAACEKTDCEFRRV